MNNAGIVSRGLAALVDMLIVVVMMGGLYIGLVLTVLMLHPTAFSPPKPGLIFSTSVTLVVAVLYLTVCWMLSGRTVGAVLLGVRVIGRRSQRLGLLVAVLRAVACVFFPVGLLWVAVDRQRRSVQDLLLGSRVIYAR